MFAKFINWLSATPFGSWLVKNVASKIDPIVFRLTKGRMISAGPPTLPMLLLYSVGRKSGQQRATQLAYVEDGEDFLVVASAMGQDRHPAWRYNIEAEPHVEILRRGEQFKAVAEVLSDEEKAKHWGRIKQTIPQMNVYEKRTTRKIRVFRLRRA